MFFTYARYLKYPIPTAQKSLLKMGNVEPSLVVLIVKPS
jgi:hypothetical protein